MDKDKRLELANLILLNPDTGIMTLVGEAAVNGEHYYSLAEINDFFLTEYVCYKDILYIAEDFDDLREEVEYQEYLKKGIEPSENTINEYIETLEKNKAIFIYVDSL